MGAVPREAALIKAVRLTVPTVKNVCMPVSGNCRFHAYISIAKRTPGPGEECHLRGVRLGHAAQARDCRR